MLVEAQPFQLTFRERAMDAIEGKLAGAVEPFQRRLAPLGEKLSRKFGPQPGQDNARLEALAITGPVMKVAPYVLAGVQLGLADYIQKATLQMPLPLLEAGTAFFGVGALVGGSLVAINALITSGATITPEIILLQLRWKNAVKSVTAATAHGYLWRFTQPADFIKVTQSIAQHDLRPALSNEIAMHIVQGIFCASMNLLIASGFADPAFKLVGDYSDRLGRWVGQTYESTGLKKIDLAIFPPHREGKPYGHEIPRQKLLFSYHGLR